MRNPISSLSLLQMESTRNYDGALQTRDDVSDSGELIFDGLVKTRRFLKIDSLGHRLLIGGGHRLKI